jgi:hypothetical protein
LRPVALQGLPREMGVLRGAVQAMRLVKELLRGRRRLREPLSQVQDRSTERRTMETATSTR